LASFLRGLKEFGQEPLKLPRWGLSMVPLGKRRVIKMFSIRHRAAEGVIY